MTRKDNFIFFILAILKKKTLDNIYKIWYCLHQINKNYFLKGGHYYDKGRFNQ